MKDADTIKLSTGKEVYAFCGIVGISLTDKENQLTYGFDGKIHVVGVKPEPDPDDLTNQEAIELAELMIARWTEYRNSIS